MQLTKFTLTNIALSIFLISDLSAAYPTNEQYYFGGKSYTFSQIMEMNEPPKGFEIVDDVNTCMPQLEKSTGISRNTMNLFALAEDGYNGMAQRSIGSNTWDIGKYSVNEIHMNALSQSISPFDLRWNDCANAVASTYVLFDFYKKGKKTAIKEIIKGDDPYEALDKVLYQFAGYNSQTEEIRQKYKERLVWMVIKSLFESENVHLWE